jgi:predicted CoA-binding protein
MNEPDLLRTMLHDSKTIAVIGLSADPAKPSHYVSEYMQQHGYKIFPVNPSLAGAEVLGEPSYATLADLPIKPDIVNVFRVPSLIPGIVDEMLALGLPNLWVQAGIVNLEAAEKAEHGGIHVVMDHCIMVEHRNYSS